jgi:hypothetical protein
MAQAPRRVVTQPGESPAGVVIASMARLAPPRVHRIRNAVWLPPHAGAQPSASPAAAAPKRQRADAPAAVPEDRPSRSSAKVTGTCDAATPRRDAASIMPAACADGVRRRTNAAAGGAARASHRGHVSRRGV